MDDQMRMLPQQGNALANKVSTEWTWGFTVMDMKFAHLQFFLL